MSNVDFVSKLIVLFTLKVFIPQTNVLSGKSRDFRAFQSSSGLAIESLNLNFALYIELLFIILCRYEVSIF